MLILGRKQGERVMIGDDIIVQVCVIDGRNVRLGFEAPPNVEVHREEIYLKSQKEKAKKPIKD